jgi:hypothetical protein
VCVCVCVFVTKEQGQSGQTEEEVLEVSRRQSREGEVRRQGAPCYIGHMGAMWG